AELRGCSTTDLAKRVEVVDETGRELVLASLVESPPAESATTVIGVRHAVGEERWFLATLAPMTIDEANGVVITTLHDVTERIRLDGRLRASEARYRRLVEAMPDIAWTTDPAGLVSMVDDRWAEYVGAPREVGTPLTADDSVHPDDRTALAAQWLACLATGDELEVTARLRRHDGAYRWHLLRAVAIRDPDGAIQGWAGTSTDIDSAKRAEEGLRLLAEATVRLDATLDLDETAVATARIAVPAFADWCFIDLIEADGSTRRAAVTTAEPGREEMVARFRDFPTNPAGGSPVATALREGRPIAVTEL